MNEQLTDEELAQEIFAIRHMQWLEAFRYHTGTGKENEAWANYQKAKAKLEQMTGKRAEP